MVVEYHEASMRPNESFHTSLSTIREQKHGPVERVLTELHFAHSCEPIDRLTVMPSWA
jgi:hypothetical protein